MRTSLIAVEDIPQASAAAVEVEIDGEPRSLILTRRGERVAAYLNLCPHAGRRLDWAPGRFLIDAGDLVCAAHGARFDRASGACLGGPCRGAGLTAVVVSVRDGRVYLDGGLAAAG